MTNNDVLRRLRFSLSLNNPQIIKVFKLAGVSLTHSELDVFLKKEEDDGYEECPNIDMNNFLDGLIILKRGLQKDPPKNIDKNHMTNNIILKKLRIALRLKDVDILELLTLGEMKLTKSELSALFRNENHRNYKSCGDQVLRKFLSGLSNQSKYKTEIGNSIK